MGGSTGTGGTTASALVPSALARLTDEQYRNTISDLFGPGLAIPTLDVDPREEGFKSVAMRKATISPRAAELYEDAAIALTEQAFADAARRAKLVPCTPAGTTDRACARQFFQTFGKRAWRRPMTDGELDLFADLATTASMRLGGFWQGLALATAGVLQSPKFLFRIELGEPDPERPGRLRYTGHEMATRLSYLLWNSTPDDELLETAARGDLQRRDGITATVTRLLASPRAGQGAGRFVEELFELHRLDGLDKDRATFPGFSPALAEAMAEETRRVIARAVFQDRTGLSRLLLSRDTFVNGLLATHYGLAVTPGNAFVPVTLPVDSERQGILGQGSFLTANATLAETSPTQRGKFVRTRLLCQEVPAPPANVDTTLPSDPAGVVTTRRQKLERHRESDSCRSCHALIDSIGLTFETFDGIGAHRDKEHGLDIDPSGALDGVAYDDLPGLLQALAGREDLGPCLARQLVRFSAGASSKTGEAGFIQTAKPTANSAILTLFEHITTSDVFRYAEVSP
jgi:hypothetical protein